MNHGLTTAVCLVAARAVHFAACMLLLAVCTFDRIIIPAEIRRQAAAVVALWKQIAAWLFLVALSLAGLSGAAWFALVAIEMSGLPPAQRSNPTSCGWSGTIRISVLSGNGERSPGSSLHWWHLHIASRLGRGCGPHSTGWRQCPVRSCWVASPGRDTGAMEVRRRRISLSMSCICSLRRFGRWDLCRWR